MNAHSLYCSSIVRSASHTALLAASLAASVGATPALRQVCERCHRPASVTPPPRGSHEAAMHGWRLSLTHWLAREAGTASVTE